MKTIRVINYSTPNGGREGVYFTEDLEKDAADVVPHGCNLDSDTLVEVENWPDLFPMDYNLDRN